MTKSRVQVAEAHVSSQPSGTSLRRYRDLVVGSKKELEALQAAVSGASSLSSGDGSPAVIGAEA